MDKWQAQDRFWNSFGIPAYDMNTVPPSAVMPYITYEAIDSVFEDVQTVTASIWYRAKTWKDISQKSDAIRSFIERMPPSVEVDGGRYRVRIPYTMPFAQRMSEPEDEDVRRIVINVEIEFMTGGTSWVNSQ